MNILEYINDLIELGYSNDEAERLADIMFSDDWDMND